MFSDVSVYLDHLKFCVVFINGRRYVCCGECYVVSDEYDEPTSCLVQPIVAHCCYVMYFGCFDFRGERGSLGANFSSTFQCFPYFLDILLLRFDYHSDLSQFPHLKTSSVSRKPNSHHRQSCDISNISERRVSSGLNTFKIQVSIKIIMSEKSVFILTSLGKKNECLN